jgi:hypothetical protein
MLVPLMAGAHPRSVVADLRPLSAWVRTVWLLIGGWVVSAALAAVRRDPLIFGGLLGLLALTALAARSPCPHLCTCFAVASALVPPPLPARAAR